MLAAIEEAIHIMKVDRKNKFNISIGMIGVYKAIKSMS